MFRPSKVTHLRQDVNDLTTPVSDCNGRRGKCIVRKYLTASVDRLHRLAGQSVPKPIWQEFICWLKNVVFFETMHLSVKANDCRSILEPDVSISSAAPAGKKTMVMRRPRDGFHSSQVLSVP